MWYLITGIIASILIVINKKERNINIVKYIIISLIMPPLGYGMWQADKPLIGKEERYGGKGWVIMRTFAIFHTIMCIIWAFFALGLASEVAGNASNDYEAAGAAIGAGIGIIMIVGIWFGGTLGSLILGLILKKPIHEKAEVIDLVQEAL